MALTGVNRGTSGNNTASTSIAIVPATSFAANSFGILAIAYDNSGGGGSDPYSSISDTIGNVWTPRVNALNDPGTASSGSVLRIFTADISTLPTSATITINFGQNTTAKAWTLTEVDGTLGTPTYSSGTQATGNGTTQTITTSVAVDNMIFGALGQEGNGTRTGDADTTNGSWSTSQNNGFGTTTAGQEIITQYKVVTAAGNQTYNPVATPLGDWCIGWVTINEVISTSFDPMGMMGIFGI